MHPEFFEEIVVFELDGQRYGLLSSAVREVLRATSFVPLPNAPPMVEGIINVRGEVAAVLNLRRRFGLRDRPMEMGDHLLLAAEGQRLYALLTDRVLEFVRTPREAVVGSDKFSHPDHVAGVAELPDGMVLIHDLSKFLSAAQTAALDRAISERPQP